MNNHTVNSSTGSGAIPEKARGLTLLTQQVREMLPPLHAQESQGSKAIAYVRLFVPGNTLAWYLIEGSPVTDDAGNVVDFEFYALVEEQYKDIYYINLSEIEKASSSLGSPIEQDLSWQPRTLEETAPELFESGEDVQE